MVSSSKLIPPSVASGGTDKLCDKSVASRPRFGGYSQARTLQLVWAVGKMAVFPVSL